MLRWMHWTLSHKTSNTQNRETCRPQPQNKVRCPSCKQVKVMQRIQVFAWSFIFYAAKRLLKGFLVNSPHYQRAPLPTCPTFRSTCPTFKVNMSQLQVNLPHLKSQCKVGGSAPKPPFITPIDSLNFIIFYHLFHGGVSWLDRWDELHEHVRQHDLKQVQLDHVKAGQVGSLVSW